MSRGVDVLGIIRSQLSWIGPCRPDGDEIDAERWDRIEAAHDRIAEVFAAARAYRASSDLVDVILTGDRLDAALAACQPTDTDHNREAVDGLCVEESNDDDR